MKQFLNWLRRRFSQAPPPPRASLGQPGASLRRTGQLAAKRHPLPPRSVPKRQPDSVEVDPHVHGRIADAGPGKNVLIRNKYRREDTGTHETLTILDDSMLDSGEEAGIDPYNTGRFDRAKNWDKRFRK